MSPTVISTWNLKRLRKKKNLFFLFYKNCPPSLYSFQSVTLLYFQWLSKIKTWIILGFTYFLKVYIHSTSISHWSFCEMFPTHLLNICTTAATFSSTIMSYMDYSILSLLHYLHPGGYYYNRSHGITLPFKIY